MASSLLTPQGVFQSGASLGGPGSKRRKLDTEGELVGVPISGGKKKRTMEGFGSDGGIYTGLLPQVVLTHIKEAAPDNSANSTAPRWSIKAANNEILRQVS
jgi:hypothetical protein